MAIMNKLKGALLRRATASSSVRKKQLSQRSAMSSRKLGNDSASPSPLRKMNSIMDDASASVMEEKMSNMIQGEFKKFEGLISGIYKEINQIKHQMNILSDQEENNNKD